MARGGGDERGFAVLGVRLDHVIARGDPLLRGPRLFQVCLSPCRYEHQTIAAAQRQATRPHANDELRYRVANRAPHPLNFSHSASGPSVSITTRACGPSCGRASIKHRHYHASLLNSSIKKGNRDF